MLLKQQAARHPFKRALVRVGTWTVWVGWRIAAQDPLVRLPRLSRGRGGRFFFFSSEPGELIMMQVLEEVTATCRTRGT